VGGASSAESAYQRHSGHEWGYVLDGRLDVRIGFEDYILEPGRNWVRVETTVDPCEVYDLHRRNRYDLILLDLEMPGGDGARSTTTSTSRRHRGRPRRADRPLIAGSDQIQGRSPRRPR
jgi:CheY-like chemotaxis protein